MRLSRGSAISMQGVAADRLHAHDAAGDRELLLVVLVRPQVEVADGRAAAGREHHGGAGQPRARKTSAAAAYRDRAATM